MKKVTIYSTQTCGYCKAAKDYFDDKNIEYEDIDVGADEEQAKIMIKKSGQMGVPVIVIGEGSDENLLIGFNQQKLEELLKDNEE